MFDKQKVAHTQVAQATVRLHINYLTIWNYTFDLF